MGRGEDMKTVGRQNVKSGDGGECGKRSSCCTVQLSRASFSRGPCAWTRIPVVSQFRTVQPESSAHESTSAARLRRTMAAPWPPQSRKSQDSMRSFVCFPLDPAITPASSASRAPRLQPSKVQLTNSGRAFRCTNTAAPRSGFRSAAAAADGSSSALGAKRQPFTSSRPFRTTFWPGKKRRES